MAALSLSPQARPTLSSDAAGRVRRASDAPEYRANRPAALILDISASRPPAWQIAPDPVRLASPAGGCGHSVIERQLAAQALDQVLEFQFLEDGNRSS